MGLVHDPQREHRLFWINPVDFLPPISVGDQGAPGRNQGIRRSSDIRVRGGLADAQTHRSRRPPRGYAHGSQHPADGIPLFVTGGAHRGSYRRCVGQQIPTAHTGEGTVEGIGQSLLGVAVEG